MIPTLFDLMVEDGVKFRGGGVNRMCLCPFHDERTPSMSVNVDRGLYKCHGCNAEGNAYNYLTRARKLQPAEAMKILDDGTGKPIKAPPPKSKPRKIWPDLPEHDARHDYRDAQGRGLFVVLRFPKDSKFPKAMPFCPVRKDGKRGWIATIPVKTGRPLYNLARVLKADAKRQVMVVEGEKCADAVTAAFPKGVCVTWASGSSSAARTDWSPIFGRPVVLIADGDDPGRKCMVKLADVLAGKGCEVKIVLPEGDDGEDIADWIQAGGPANAAKIIRSLVKPYKPVVDEEPPLPEDPRGPSGPKKQDLPPAPSGLFPNDRFTVLGEGPGVVYVQKSNNEFLGLPRASLLKRDTLVIVAPMKWWETLCGAGGFTAAMCVVIGDALLREAERLGRVSLKDMVGVGLAVDSEGKLAWNLGDRILADGKEYRMGEFNDRLTAVPGPRFALSKSAATEDHRRDVARAVMAYRWKSKSDGRAFLGWLTTALIGGGLPWRPHVWITAPAETGKSWIVRNVAERFFGPTCLKLANVTPAGLTALAESASLPVIVDEAEPESQHLQGVIETARVAAGGDGMRVRADGRGGAIMSNPRFSMMLSSVRSATLSDADSTRLFPIELGDPVPDWPDVERSIEASLAGDLPIRLRTALVGDAGKVIDRAREFTRAMIKARVKSREAHISGALSAGWEWWSGQVSFLTAPKTIARESDTVSLLQEILTLTERFNGEDIPLFELVVGNDYRKARAATLGLKLGAKDDLMIAWPSPGLRRKLRGTDWAQANVGRALGAIPGASHSNGSVRFGPGVRKRAIHVPRDACIAAGFDIAEARRVAPAEATTEEIPY